MQNHIYFRRALADFTYEAASGGAIRHLADMGYTVRQISQRLDFPTPYERVQKSVWEHFVHTGMILLEEPGSGRQRENVPQGKSYQKKASYVREYDQYGKASFRRVAEEEEEVAPICWKKQWLGEGEMEENISLILTKVHENGIEYSYMSCDFGKEIEENTEKLKFTLGELNQRQREYLTGLPWEKFRVYHRMDSRITEILLRLYEVGAYHGICYFLKTGEMMIFGDGFADMS